MKKAVVVGGGFAGCTAAYMLKQKGFEITILEGGPFIGGGCRTFFYHGHPYTYGPRHLLVDVNEMYVWDYFSKFLDLRELVHHTMTYVSQDDRFYTFPIHRDEINVMPDRAKILEELENKPQQQPRNFEEFWVGQVGATLYDKFINHYSTKMWLIKNNRMLDEFDFSPKGDTLKSGSRACFEGEKVIGYPREPDGYNSYFDKCVEDCQVRLNCFVDTFDLDNKKIVTQEGPVDYDILISTTSLDILLDYQYGELPYVGRDFVKLILPVERITPEPYYFIHYAGDEPYTRVVEYKLLTGYQSPDTLIIIETPSFNNKLYPYPIKSEIAKANRYFAALPADVYSIGRQGKYRYDNMDEVVKDCMELMKKI